MKKEKENKEWLQKLATELGVDLFAVADVREAREEFNLDQKLRERFDRGLSLGKRLIRPVLENIKDSPTALYLHHYRQINFFLDRTAFLISSHIQKAGYNALPIPASQIIDWQKQEAHLSHKKLGLLAGLGWIGRNNLLVNPDFGAQFRLVSILTDLPLEPGNPLDSDCGQCFQCLPCCPAKAIKINSRDFDHQKCFEKLKEFKRSGIVSQHICGVCVRACSGSLQT